MGSQFSVKDAQWVHPSNFINYNKIRKILWNARIMKLTIQGKFWVFTTTEAATCRTLLLPVTKIPTNNPFHHQLTFWSINWSFWLLSWTTLCRWLFLFLPNLAYLFSFTNKILFFSHTKLTHFILVENTFENNIDYLGSSKKYL